ncbi:MAG: hypothetical protein GWM98_14160 [Nitrospinaceae bacterium]|nr:hypothetical protein [Nitrospinaceae bacterium]NIR55412.1 hypothetical protein [Nitrospinaceae bacterium]NIS85852.1 hypothetical protein [Nitrospinaceae bacterium]NIT82696.1 hypothetical protein [Nitrospinaceae bacterium]NIU45905.1 hypothetical protein [Nitrospinaceae bacterium]
MKLSVKWIVFLLVLQPSTVWADGVNFPSDTWGISFGNSKQFTGLRFNIADKDVEQVTGLNMTLGVPLEGRHYTKPAGEFNGLNIGLLGPLGKRFNGITLGPLLMGAGDFNGIMIAGGGMTADDHLRGLAAGLVLVDAQFGAIDGVALAGFGVRADRLRGISIGLVGNPIHEVHGLVLGAFNINRSVTGIQIGLFNSADQLNGIQIGLVNHAVNNSVPFQYLPVFNAHFSF